MKGHSSTRALIESALLTGITVILILMTIYVPLFLLIGVFVWPLPLALIYVRNGAKYSIMSLIVAGIITAMISDPVTAFGLVFTYGILGIVLGFCLEKKKSSTVTIIIMTVVSFVTMALSFKLVSLIMGQDVIGQGMQLMSQSFDTVSKMYSSMGVPKEVIEQARKSFDPQLMKMMLPTLLFFSAFMVSVLIYMFARLIFKRFGYAINPIKPFSEWYVPISVAFSVIAIVFIAYALSYFKIKNSGDYLRNAVMLLQLLFTISGLAAIEFFLKKKNVAKGIRIAIYFFVLTSQLGNIIFYVGIIDYAMDLRKLDPHRRRYV